MIDVIARFYHYQDRGFHDWHEIATAIVNEWRAAKPMSGDQELYTLAYDVFSTIRDHVHSTYDGTCSHRFTINNVCRGCGNLA